MRSTAIDRRRFLAAAGGGALTAALGGPALAKEAAPLYLGSRRDGGSGYRVTAFDRQGAPRFDLPIPGRGHAFAVDRARGVAVHFARRPGRWAAVIDLPRGRVERGISTPDDRHFYGHGVFSPDGRLLYAGENDFEAARGVIGVYDVADGYRRVGELPSHGIGPHQIGLLPDGRTLVAANTGIATRPDLPRVKLNLPTMAPTLAFVDRRDGRLEQRVALPEALHLLSIRHLGVDRGGRPGRTAFGVQYQGPAGDTVPLIGLVDPGAAQARMLDTPAAAVRAMDNYVGSIEFDRSGAFVAASSPRGGVVTVWSAEDGAHVGTFAIRDVCGLTPAARGGCFMASDGTGGLSVIEAATGRIRPLDTPLRRRSAWDNHLAAV